MKNVQQLLNKEVGQMKGEEFLTLLNTVVNTFSLPKKESRKLPIQLASEVSGKHIFTIKRYLWDDLIINYNNTNILANVIVDEEELENAIKVQNDPELKDKLRAEIKAKRERLNLSPFTKRAA